MIWEVFFCFDFFGRIRVVPLELKNEEGVERGGDEGVGSKPCD